MTDEKSRTRKEIMEDIQKLAPDRQRKVVEGALLVIDTPKLEAATKKGKARPNLARNAGATHGRLVHPRR